MNDLWTALDRIIAAAPDAAALRTHGLGPIAAWRMRQRGEPALYCDVRSIFAFFRATSALTGQPPSAWMTAA